MCSSDLLVFFTVLSETASASETQAALATFYAALTETANSVDSSVAVRVANVFPYGVELVVDISDVVIWAVIPTPSDPNWVNIATGSTSWTDVVTTATSWTDVPT